MKCIYCERNDKLLLYHIITSQSPFLCSMFLNDIEEHLELNGFKGINMYMTKLVILLYVDDIVVFSDSTEGQQNDLDSLFIFRDGNSKLMS